MRERTRFVAHKFSLSFHSLNNFLPLFATLKSLFSTGFWTDCCTQKSKLENLSVRFGWSGNSQQAAEALEILYDQGQWSQISKELIAKKVPEFAESHKVSLSRRKYEK